MCSQDVHMYVHSSYMAEYRSAKVRMNVHNSFGHYGRFKLASLVNGRSTMRDSKRISFRVLLDAVFAYNSSSWH